MLARRQILRGAAVCAAAASLPSRAPALPLAAPGNRVQIVDADFDVTPYLAQLKSAGVQTVGRYYDRTYGSEPGESCYHHQSKMLTPAELAAIESAGLSVFVVFQHCASRCANFDLQNPQTANKGRKDAEAAVALARALGQPPSTPIYFAIDFDPYPGGGCALPAARLWPSLDAYFDQVNAVLAHTRWQVGVYGAGITCQRLKATGRASFFWISTSLGHVGTPEFFNGGQWHLFQNVVEIKRSYAPDTFDADLANPARSYFGQWTLRGPAPAQDAATAAAILDSRAFMKKGCVIVTSPPSGKSRGGNRLNHFTSTCRIMTAEERGYFGINLNEDDGIDGYVRRSDLVLGGLRKNMPEMGNGGRCGPSRETLARPPKR